MGELNAVDYAIIVTYLCVLVGIGVWLSRKASSSIEDYFLGGRRMPWWLLGVSGMSSFLDVAGTMLIVSFLYLIGPRGLFIEFRGGAVLILAVIMLWSGKWNRRSGVMTGAEWMEHRFGSGLGGQFARIVSALAVVAFVVGALAYMLKALGLALSMFLPFEPSTCAAIMLVIATAYTLASGFYGVVYTDLFQSFIMVGAAISISIMAAMQIAAHPMELDALAEQVTGVTSWTAATPSPHVDMPPGYEQFNPLLAFALIYLLKAIVQGAGMGNDQKYYGARNERETGTLTIFWAILMTVRWPMMMGFAVLGLYLVNDRLPDQRVLRDAAIDIQRTLIAEVDPTADLPLEDLTAAASVAPPGQWASLARAPDERPEIGAEMLGLFGDAWPGRLQELTVAQGSLEALIPAERWQDLTARIDPQRYPDLAQRLEQRLGERWREEVKLISYEGTVNPERILPAVILYIVPMGLRGLLIMALLAASMSTFDTGVNQCAAHFTRDLYQRFWRPQASNRELMFATYAFILALVSTGYAFAYSTRTINDIWSWLTMAFVGGLLVPGTLKFYWWRFNAGGVIWGTLFGVGGAVVDRLFDLTTHIKPFFPDSWSGEIVGFTWLLVVGGLGAVLGSLLSKPQNPETLRRFYVGTRPFGLWGPLKRELPDDVRAYTTREHRNDLLALPFALLWQICMFLTPMLLVIGAWAAAGTTAALMALGFAGVWFFWYRHLPPAELGVINSVEKVREVIRWRAERGRR